ncbi:MAG: pyruvate formate lyase family protein [Thermodesulfobacteriota bacterium]|nr:pyruvate formate lyase family protein [Thermodesulfobacteriota bacterium]
MAQTEIKKGEKELYDDRQYWWWAEKKRSPRLNYLRKAVWSKATKGSSWLPGVHMDLENIRWYTKTFKEAPPSESFIITRARALANLLDNMPVFITDNSRIVGYPGSAPHLITWIPTASSTLNDDTLNDRTGITPDEDLEEAKELVDFWNGRTYEDKCVQYMNRREKVLRLMAEFVSPGREVVISDYVTIQPDWMYQGFDSIINTIDENIKDAEKKMRETPTAEEQVSYMEKIDTWKAMKICLEATIRYARRLSRLAKILAENFETDAKRRQELLQISETCNKVPAKPPEHLWEAMQFDHIVQVAYRLEWHNNSWQWRQDYWHWPFYKKDVLEEKNLTKDEVVEYCAEWMISAFGFARAVLRGGREALQGTPGPYVWTLGGVDEDGKDACNDLTDCYLEAALLARVCDPTFGFRYHSNVRTETLRRVFECIRHGLGYPSLRNDDVLIPNLMHWFGHPLKEARRWVHQACMAPAPDTKWAAPALRYPSSSIALGAKAVTLSMFDGFDPTSGMQIGIKTGDCTQFETFDDFFNAWYDQMKAGFDMATGIEHRNRYVEAHFYPKPMTSALFERCIETGKNSALCNERSSLWFTLFAFTDTGDCLAAVKKLVYDDKKYTMAELKKALEANWEGYEEMRMDFVRAPKWGNDEDYVDKVWVKVYEALGKISWSVKDINGQPRPTLPESIAAHVVGATKIGALPNGRRFGDPLYDGGCSPGCGFDKKGPTAVLKSVGKLDHVGTVRATLLNQRLSPAQLQGEKGFKMWRDYMKTWHDLGINHVQFNMVDNETLYAAQREPEKYGELMVRIAGYSAHFVEMNKITQDAIIARNVQKF